MANLSLQLKILNLCKRFTSNLKQWQYMISSQFYPEPFAAVDLNYCSQYQLQESSDSSFDSILGDGFLWAVPAKRRTIERRLTRKMGAGKMLVPKRNLLVCDVCGHYHEAFTICGNCYERVLAETEAMKDAIQKELKLDPVDKEVIVLFQDDPRENTNDKIIVEMPKERSPWFSKNLLSKGNVKTKQTSVGNVSLQPVIKE